MTAETLSKKLEGGQEITATELRSQTDVQIRELGKSLKEKIRTLKEAGISGDEDIAKMNALLELARDLFNIRKGLQDEREKVRNAKPENIKIKYEEVEFTYNEKKQEAMKKTQRIAYDLLQANKEARERDVAPMRQLVEEVKNAKNLDAKAVENLQSRINEKIKVYKNMKMLNGMSLPEGHPLKEFQEAYYFLSTVTLYKTEKAETLVQKGFSLESQSNKIAFLSDINGDGNIASFEREKHWFKKDTFVQNSIVGEQQLYKVLKDYVANGGNIKNAYKSVTGEKNAPDFSNKEKAAETRERFNKILADKVSAYATLATTLLSISDKTLVSGGLVAIIEGKEDRYREELIKLAENPKEIKDRITEAQKNFSPRERKNFWEKVGGALGKIGLGALLGPIHFAIHTETLGTRGLVADAGGKDVTAKAMIRGILPEVEGSTESQNQVFQISEDWEKLLKASVDSRSLQINITDKNKFSDIAGRMQKLLQANAKKGEIIPAGTAEAQLKNMVTVLNANFTKDKVTITGQKDSSIREKYINGSILSARDTLGVTLASALRDPVKWSPMIGVGAGIQGVFMDVLKREKTTVKTSAGTAGENAVSGAEQNATREQNKDLKTYFNISKTILTNGSYQYVFDVNGKADQLYPKLSGGVTFESSVGPKKIVSKVPLMFMEVTHYSNNLENKTLRIRLMTQKERSELDAENKRYTQESNDHKTAKGAQDYLNTAVEGNAKSIDAYTQKETNKVLEGQIKKIRDRMEHISSSDIRIYFFGLQKKVANGFRTGKPIKAFDALVAFHKYPKNKNIFKDIAVGDGPDSLDQKALILSVFLQETAGDGRIRNYDYDRNKKGAKTLEQLEKLGAWGGEKINKAFNDRIADPINEEKGQWGLGYSGDLGFLKTSRENFDMKLRGLSKKTTMKSIEKTESNVMAFVNFSQVMYGAKGSTISKFRGIMPLAGSITIAGDAQPIDVTKDASALEFRNKLIENLPKFVLEEYLQQIKKQIREYNIKIKEANKSRRKNKQIQEMPAISESDLIGLLKETPVQQEIREADGVKKNKPILSIQSELKYARYTRCLNDVYFLSGLAIKPSIPGLDVPLIPLKTPTIDKGAIASSSSLGTQKVVANTLQVGGGESWSQLNEQINGKNRGSSVTDGSGSTGTGQGD